MAEMDPKEERALIDEASEYYREVPTEVLNDMFLNYTAGVEFYTRTFGSVRFPEEDVIRASVLVSELSSREEGISFH